MDVASFDELRAKVESTRLEYKHALEQYRATFNTSGGLPYPDGSQLFRNANETLRLARERYTEAVQNLTSHVLQRTHPGRYDK